LQQGLTAQEAALLAGRLARALQAFHDQGACHGRLGPDWVLIRGDLEPVLCPCGVPAQAGAERSQDMAAPGTRLEGWLPSRPRWHFLAPLYRVADAARAGHYVRAADLANDLERAAAAVRFGWREHWANRLVMLLLVLPLLLYPLGWALGRSGLLTNEELLAI